MQYSVKGELSLLLWAALRYALCFWRTFLNNDETRFSNVCEILYAENFFASGF